MTKEQQKAHILAQPTTLEKKREELLKAGYSQGAVYAILVTLKDQTTTA